MHEKCQGKTDEELVVLSLRDEDYFWCLIKRYEQKLLRYIIRISGISKEEAEDILQEVFIKVYQNLNNFDSSLKFSSWIYRITHNQVISNYRKLQARPQNVNWELNEEMLNNISSDLDIEKEVNIKYLRENIEKVLNKLDKKYKEILILRFFEEKSYEEMSDILKKPMGTIATLVNRAKKHFKEEVAKQGINF